MAATVAHMEYIFCQCEVLCANLSECRSKRSKIKARSEVTAVTEVLPPQLFFPNGKDNALL
jgi:hypothetical protein